MYVLRRAHQYHDDIDSHIESLYDFIHENYSDSISEYSLKTLSVFAFHISALIAIDRYFPETHRVYINTLTRTLAFRTPDIQPEVEPHDGEFVSYCGLEESFMHEQTETFKSRGVSPLIHKLVQQLGGKEDDYGILQEQIESAAERAKATYLPHLVSM